MWGVKTPSVSERLSRRAGGPSPLRPHPSWTSSTSASGGWLPNPQIPYGATCLRGAWSSVPRPARWDSAHHVGIVGVGVGASLRPSRPILITKIGRLWHSIGAARRVSASCRAHISQAPGLQRLSSGPEASAVFLGSRGRTLMTTCCLKAGLKRSASQPSPDTDGVLPPHRHRVSAARSTGSPSSPAVLLVSILDRCAARP